MKVTNIDLYKYFGWPKPSKTAKGILHGIFFDEESDEFDKKRVHPMMLIFPGGAYTQISHRESVAPCLSFLTYGYNCFYLEYSLAPKNTYPTQLVEAMMALTYLYKKAKDMNSDPNKIVACGFSAGAHLAGLLASVTKEERDLFYPLDKCGASLKAIIYSYPVVTEENQSVTNLLGGHDVASNFSLLNRLDGYNIPTFIWAGEKDDVVDPNTNAKALYNSIKNLKIPTESLFFPNAKHGYSTGDVNTYSLKDDDIEARKEVASWVKEAADFLTKCGAGLNR